MDRHQITVGRPGPGRCRQAYDPGPNRRGAAAKPLVRAKAMKQLAGQPLFNCNAPLYFNLTGIFKFAL